MLQLFLLSSASIVHFFLSSEGSTELCDRLKYFPLFYFLFFPRPYVGSFPIRPRKPRESKQPKARRPPKPKGDEGLSAKQKAKIKSKAFVSSSEDSDSDDEKLKIVTEM